MRDRFVTWGTRDGKRHLFTFELDAEDAQIIRRIIPAEASEDEILQTILNAWNNHATMIYPDGTEREQVELTTQGTIVPPGADVDDKVRVASAEREWPFDVVSARLRKQFQAEFEELADVISGLVKYDEVIFERLKNAWNKVQSEINDKVLRYEHSLELRKLSDELFERVKELRRGKEKQVRNKSKEIKKEFRAKLNAAQTKLEEKADLRALFQELQKIQSEVNKAQLSRDDRNSLRKNIDELFKATKSEIAATGADAGFLSEQRTRLSKRLDGLNQAINRMGYSLDRDDKDMYYENRRIQEAGNQFAEQLGAAKMAMLKERFESKRVKYDDMLATRDDLQKKLDKVIQREERAKEKVTAQAQAHGTPVASSDGPVKATGKRKAKQKAIVPNQMISDAASAIDLANAAQDVG